MPRKFPILGTRLSKNTRKKSTKHRKIVNIFFITKNTADMGHVLEKNKYTFHISYGIQHYKLLQHQAHQLVDQVTM